MFGYIRPYVPELKIKEYELYKSIYCGLCRSLSKNTGEISRFTLNYDSVFLAIIRTLVSSDFNGYERKRCFVHPVKKRNMAKASESIKYCAFVNVILSYNKLIDNKNDEKGLSKLISLVCLSVMGSAYKRTSQYEELSGNIAHSMKVLFEKEKSDVSSPDEVAEIFGEILGEAFSFGIDGKAREDAAKKRILFEIGKHTGKFIYFADAASDLEKDEKSGNYNPFIKCYGISANEIREKYFEEIKRAMENEICEIEKAMALIDVGDYYDLYSIAENIVYCSMPRIADKTAKGTFGKEKI